MRDDVHKILQRQFEIARRYQKGQKADFQLTLEQFITLWSPYRLKQIATRLDHGTASIGYFLTCDRRPVCGWKQREDKASGVMHIGNARILPANQSKRMFGMQKGEKHSPQAIEKMRKPKAALAKANMRDAALKRWAKVRGEVAA